MNNKNPTDHYNSIILEDIKSKMDMVIDGMYTIKNELTIRIDRFEFKVDKHFDLVEAAIKSNREAINENTQSIKSLQESLIEIF